MAKKKDSSLVPASERASIVINESYFEFLKGWNKLEVRDKDYIINETRAIFEQHAKFKQVMAIHLLNVRKKLLPLKMYETYLAALAERNIISRATANRYVREYEYLQLHLPGPLLEQAIKEDMQINIGLIEHIPPPKGNDPEENKVWLTRVSRMSKGHQNPGPPPDGYKTLHKQNVNQIKLDYAKLPNNAKTRQRWITDLCGMILWIGNIQTPQTIAPQAIPDELTVVRGRPKGSTKQAS